MIRFFLGAAAVLSLDDLGEMSESEIELSEDEIEKFGIESPPKSNERPEDNDQDETSTGLEASNADENVEVTPMTKEVDSPKSDEAVSTNLEAEVIPEIQKSEAVSDTDMESADDHSIFIFCITSSIS